VLPVHRGRFAKIDIGDAYIKGTRQRPLGYMYMPGTIKEYDEDGTELVIELTTPLWGEQEAGFEWDAELHERLISFGWRSCEGIPAMYYFNGPSGDAYLVKIVDDLGVVDFSKGRKITTDTIELLKSAYDSQVTYDLEPKSFAGYKTIFTEEELTISQPEKITEAARKYLPELLEGKVPARILKGKALDDLLASLKLPTTRSGKLSPASKRTQQIIGDLKYIERGSCPRLTKMLHSLSCVMNEPPEEAVLAAESVLAEAFQSRDEPLRFNRRSGGPQRKHSGGRMRVDLKAGAPASFEASADASTADPVVYSLLVTYCGSTIAALCKKVGVKVNSTYDAENIATLKVADLVLLGRLVLTTMGVDLSYPTIIMTDNLANERVIKQAKAAANAKHLLRRQACLHQHVADGHIAVIHVPDTDNPSDFLSKFYRGAKRDDSIAYAMGATG
jgi:hypothetical protein